MGQRASFSTKLGVIAATAGSSIGLGNIWRFPYLAAKYGGGTFLLTYVVLVFTFGVSLLLLETALGRKTGQSAIGAFKAFGKKYAFIGILASAVPFIITPYYCIIGGWVTKYTAAYLVNGPEALADGGDFFTGFITSNAESYIWMLVFMAIVFAVCTYHPNYKIYVFLIGPVKLIHLAIFTAVIDLLSIPSGNAGGHIAHLGGALFGYLFTLSFRRNLDLTKGLSSLFTKLGNSRLFRKKTMRVKYKKKVSDMNDMEYNEYKKRKDDRINRILDKISKHGYESLTKEEKEILFKSKNN